MSRSIREGVDAARTHSRLWRLAGWLALGHVVLLFGGFALERTPGLGDSPSATAAALNEGSMAVTFAGGYIETIGFLVLLVAAMLLARLLRGAGETAAWLSSCVAASAVSYVAITLGSGFPAGAAAVYDGHHGAPLATVTAINDVRNFAFFLSVAVLGVFTMSVAAAVRVTGALPRWVAHTGLVTGVVCLVSVAGAGWGLHDYATLLQTVWFVGLAVSALLRGRRAAAPVPSAAADATV